jgi:hypothetical protein
MSPSTCRIFVKPLADFQLSDSDGQRGRNLRLVAERRRDRGFQAREPGRTVAVTGARRPQVLHGCHRPDHQGWTLSKRQLIKELNFVEKPVIKYGDELAIGERAGSVKKDYPLGLVA